MRSLAARATTLLVLALLVTVVLAGCATKAPLAPAPRPAVLSPAPLANYLHNVSEHVPGITVWNAIIEHHRIPSTDGVQLDTWIMRPDIADQVPLVLIITPYHAGGEVFRVEDTGSFTSYYLLLLEDLFLRGYAVGVSSVRGTGNSEGCYLQSGRQEAIDSVAVIEELARQSWSNGRVGLFGASADGTTAQDVWVEAPPSLKTIVPIVALSDGYKQGFVNGVPIWAQGFVHKLDYWMSPGLISSPAYGIGATDPASYAAAIAGEACPEQVAIQEGGISSAMDGNKDAFWIERDFLAELSALPDRERAAVFYVAGLQDWNVNPSHMEDWLDALWDTGVPMKAWLGQWPHGYPPHADWDLALLAWFDQFLKGINTGILDAPAVQVQDDAGNWRHEQRWPPEVDWLKLHPDQAGRLANTPGQGQVSYDAFDANGVLSAAHLTGAVPRDMVVWESDVLTEDWHLSGQPVFEATVTATARRAALMLTLIERTDVDRPINYAAISLNHVNSLQAGDADISGKDQLVRVRFFPQENVVHAGSRLVLIAAGNLVLPDDDPVAGFTSGTSGLSLMPITDGGTINVSLEGASLMIPLDPSIVYEEASG